MMMVIFNKNERAILYTITIRILRIPHFISCRFVL